MAVLCEAISVLVPKSVVNERYPGGITQYKLAVPNDTYCTDGLLTRVGFMHSNDVIEWVGHLTDCGLVFIADTTLASPQAIDIVVVDQLTGPTCSCSWLTTVVEDGVRWAWVTATGFGTKAAPVNWAPAQSASMVHHSPEAEAGLPFTRGPFGDQTLDPATGDTLFVGRAFPSVRNRDEAIRAARDAVALNRLEEAYQYFRRAEGYAELTPADKVLAARVCYCLCTQSQERAQALGIQAAQRWREIIDLGIVDGNDAWFLLARSEAFAGNWDAAAACLERILDLDPDDPYALAERAFVAVARREPSSVPAHFMSQALSRALETNDKRAQEYITAIMQALKR